MVEPFESIQSGRLGGLQLPNCFQPGVETPQAVCFREASRSGRQAQPPAPSGCILAARPPCLQWVALQELTGKHKPRAAQDAAFEAVMHQLSDDALTSSLLRPLLAEELGARGLQSAAACRGSHLVACTAESAGGRTLDDEHQALVLYATGAIRQQVALAAVSRPGTSHSSQAHRLESAGVSVVDIAHQSIQELQLMQHTAAASRSLSVPGLVAVRCTCCVAVLQLRPPTQQGDLWTLKPLALQRTRLRTLHMTWSRAVAHELVYGLEDGSLHLMRVSTDTTSSPARASWQAAQCHCVLPAGQLEPHWVSGSRLTASFAPHPRQLLLGAGPNLLGCSISAPGQPAPPAEVLHTRTDHSSFVALATADEARQDRDAANLLAALTERHVLLFDVRRPAQPLLQWPHGLAAARPQQLSLFCRSGADEAVAEGPAEAVPLHGRIVVASLGTGDAVLFPFTLRRSAVALLASPRESTAAAQRSRRREGAAQQGFRGKLLLEDAPEPGTTRSGAASVGEEPAFRWRPLLGVVAAADGLPRRLAAPLGVRPRSAAAAPAEQHPPAQVHPGVYPAVVSGAAAPGADTALAALHPSVPWPDLQHAPDLQGFTIVPLCNAASASSATDALLLRLNFLGDLFIDDCGLFSRQLPYACSNGSMHGGGLQFIDAQWQQQQSDGSYKHLASAEEVTSSRMGTATSNDGREAAQEEWQPKRQKGRGQIRRRGSTRRLKNGTYCMPITATHAAVSTAMAWHAAQRAPKLAAASEGQLPCSVPSSVEDAAAATIAAAALALPGGIAEVSVTQATHALNAVLATAAVALTDQELTARWRAQMPVDLLNADGSDEDMFTGQPQAIGASVPHSSRTAAAPSLSASTRQARLSAAVQHTAAAAGGGSSEADSNQLQAFRAQLAEHLRNHLTLEAWGWRMLQLPPLTQLKVDGCAGEEAPSDPGCTRGQQAGGVMYPVAVDAAAEGVDILQHRTVPLRMDNMVHQDELSSDAAMLLDKLTAAWQVRVSSISKGLSAAMPNSVAASRRARTDVPATLVSPLRRAAAQQASQQGADTATNLPASTARHATQSPRPLKRRAITRLSQEGF